MSILSKKGKQEKELLEKIDAIIESYNNACNYLNKYVDSNKIINADLIKSIDNDNKKEVKKKIRKAIKNGIRVTTLNRIINQFKFLKDGKLSINNIFINPFYFISEQYGSMISFNNCIKLIDTFNIEINTLDYINKWKISLFKQNIYIPYDDGTSDSYIYHSNKFKNDLLKMSKLPETSTHMKQIYKNLTKNFISLLRNDFKFKNIDEPISNGRYITKKYITTKYLHNLQKILGTKIKNLYLDTDGVPIKNGSLESDIYSFIKKFEKNKSKKESEKRETEIKFVFDTEQREAIYNLIIYNLGILTGFPGSGKTDILDCVCGYLEKIGNKNISLTAPTGLATNNLVDRCDSITKNKEINYNLHKLIYNIFPKIEESFNKSDSTKDKELSHYIDSFTNEEREQQKNIELIEWKQKKIYFVSNLPDVIVLDEASMVDLKMFNSLINFCESYDIKLILCGDVKQLPPINGGNPLKDLIDSKLFKVNRLQIIHRNTGCLTKCIKTMSSNTISKNDFTDNSISYENIKKYIFTENIDTLKKLIQKNKFTKENTKFLTAQKDGDYGSISLNICLQNLFNKNGKVIPNSLYYYNKYQFRENDKIIRVVNCYDNDYNCFANGDTAIIDSIDYDEFKNIKHINIKYDNKKTERISLIQLYEEFQLSYALSVHKSQGQGYDNIIIFIPDEHSFMWGQKNDSKNLLYTAISRAKQHCIVMCDYNLFIDAQENIYYNPGIFMKKFN